METYWATVAQIAAVLGLALVLEAREFGRRAIRKRVFKRTLPERVSFAIVATIAGATLVLSFALAIAALSSGQDMDSQVTLAAGSLGVAFGAVVVNPLLPILWALVGDVRAYFAVAMEARRDRRIEQVIALAVAEADRELTSRALDWMIPYAKNLTLAHAALRFAKRQNDHERYLRADSYLDELAAARLEFAAVRASQLADVAGASKALAEAKSLGDKDHARDAAIDRARRALAAAVG